MKGMNFFILVVGCLLLAACTPVDEPKPGVSAVSFSTEMEKIQTRYASGELPESMGVFACLTKGSDCTPATFTSNFMYNQLVKHNGADWSYTPVKYWPSASGDKLSFLAYAPYLDEIKTNGDDVSYASTNATVGYPEIIFTNNTGTTDLLFASPVLNQTFSASGVAFTLKHALAKISFHIQNGDATSGKQLHSLSVLAPKNGKYPVVGENGYTVSGNEVVRHTVTSTTADIPANTTESISLGSLYVHPDAAKTKYSLTYSINGSAANTITFNDVALPSAPVLAAGANIVYTITVNKDTYDIKASNVTEWAQSGERDIVCYGPDDLKLGDYYYSDGTTSDGGVRTVCKSDGECTLANPLPEPVAGKTCAGLVYYVGRHPTDDCDYKMKDGTTPMTTVNGYVIALEHLSGNGLTSSNGGWVKWGSGGDGGQYGDRGSILSGASTDVNDYRGYSNTHQIKATAEAQGVWANNIYHWPYQILTSYGTSLSPAASSGWYMPSVGQMKEICKYRQTLQVMMEKFGKNINALNDCFTSTELNAGSAYRFNNFSTGGSVSTDAKPRRIGSRVVLTF